MWCFPSMREKFCLLSTYRAQFLDAEASVEMLLGLPPTGCRTSTCPPWLGLSFLAVDWSSRTRAAGQAGSHCTLVGTSENSGWDPKTSFACSDSGHLLFLKPVLVSPGSFLGYSQSFRAVMLLGNAETLCYGPSQDVPGNRGIAWFPLPSPS